MQKKADKIIELVKDYDGVYREGKEQPKQASFKIPARSKRKKDHLNAVHRTANGRDLVSDVVHELEEIGEVALQTLINAFRGIR